MKARITKFDSNKIKNERRAIMGIIQLFTRAISPIQTTDF